MLFWGQVSGGRLGGSKIGQQTSYFARLRAVLRYIATVYYTVIVAMETRRYSRDRSPGTSEEPCYSPYIVVSRYKISLYDDVRPPCTQSFHTDGESFFCFIRRLQEPKVFSFYYLYIFSFPKNWSFKVDENVL